MKLLTDRALIRTIAKRWAAQYPDSKLDIREALERLDTETATADDVAEIIGNRYWTGPFTCSECNQARWDIVELGEEPDYESDTARICGDCLRAALNLLDGGV